jgi:hypothetical protein
MTHDPFETEDSCEKQTRQQPKYFIVDVKQTFDSMRQLKAHLSEHKISDESAIIKGFPMSYETKTEYVFK